jgi:hypothetical protein
VRFIRHTAPRTILRLVPPGVLVHLILTSRDLRAAGLLHYGVFELQRSVLAGRRAGLSILDDLVHHFRSGGGSDARVGRVYTEALLHKARDSEVDVVVVCVCCVVYVAGSEEFGETGFVGGYLLVAVAYCLVVVVA